jgi:hypothetical protein
LDVAYPTLTDVVDAFDNVTVNAKFAVPLLPSARLALAIDNAGNLTLVAAAETVVRADVVVGARPDSRFSISRRTNDSTPVANWPGMPGTLLPHGDDGNPNRFTKLERFPEGDAVAAATCGVVTSAAAGLIGDATAATGAPDARVATGAADAAAATGAADAAVGRPALAAFTMRDCAEVTGAQSIPSEWNVARLF